MTVVATNLSLSRWDLRDEPIEFLVTGVDFLLPKNHMYLHDLFLQAFVDWNPSFGKNIGPIIRK